MSFCTPDQVRQWLSATLNCRHLKVVGDGQHFEALIVSDSFAGLSTVKRHQLVYQALGLHMQNDIHALSMRTLSGDEWDGGDGGA